MKCYLAKNQQIQLGSLLNVYPKNFRFRDEEITLEISPLEDETKDSLLLQSILEAYKNEVQSESFWVIRFGIGVSWTKTIPSETSGECYKCCVELGINSPGNILEALRHFWGSGVTVKAEFDVLDERNGSKCTFTTKEMSIYAVERTPGNSYKCKDPTLRFPRRHIGNFDDKTLFPIANVTITVSLPDELLTSGMASTPTCQKILDEEILSDVTIVNEPRTKAHENFLAARSSVFLAMFKSFLSESFGNVQFADISEDDVKVFLKHLCQKGTSFKDANSQLLFELLYSAHYYHVSNLKQLIKEIILKKPKNWYDVQTVQKMLRFAGRLTPEHEDLKIHAMEALALYRKKVEQPSTTPQILRKIVEGCTIF